METSFRLCVYEIESLEYVQKFAHQVCLKSWDSEYNELLRYANLPPLHKRRALPSIQNRSYIASGIFHPYYLPGRPGRMLIDLSYSPNLSHSPTLISIPSYPMWSHCEIVYLNLLCSLTLFLNSLSIPHSLFLNNLSIISFCNFIS